METIIENGVVYNSSKTRILGYTKDIPNVLSIPDSVTSLGDYAFNGCSKLTSITIPDSVTEVGCFSFYGCTSLTSITVKEGNPNYSSDEYGALFNKDKTMLVKYPIGNTRTSYTIPDSVMSIGSSAFSGCTGLTSVTIPDGVTSIGDYAFENCRSLAVITIPNSVTSIGRCAFEWCTGLTSINIPDSVTEIGDYVFSGCSSLTSVTIPDSVTSIGERAFDGTGVYNDSSNWENDVLYIGNHLIKAKTSISGDYTIKSGTKTIAGAAFRDCSALTSVTIPDSVTSIDISAFSASGLTSIKIGNGVTIIGRRTIFNNYNESVRH